MSDTLGKVPCMSEMIEIVPSRCPECGASWARPGSVRPSWGSPLGQRNGRTWWCDTCGAEVYQGEIKMRAKGHLDHPG